MAVKFVYLDKYLQGSLLLAAIVFLSNVFEEEFRQRISVSTAIFFRLCILAINNS